MKRHPAGCLIPLLILAGAVGTIWWAIDRYGTGEPKASASASTTSTTTTTIVPVPATVPPTVAPTIAATVRQSVPARRPVVIPVATTRPSPVPLAPTVVTASRPPVVIEHFSGTGPSPSVGAFDTSGTFTADLEAGCPSSATASGFGLDPAHPQTPTPMWTVQNGSHVVGGHRGAVLTQLSIDSTCAWTISLSVP